MRNGLTRVLLVLAAASTALAAAAGAQAAVLREVEPRALAVGEPLRLAIRVEHAPGERVALLELADALGIGWAELSQELRPVLEADIPADKRVSELVLVLTPLESGALELPRLYVELSGGPEPYSLTVGGEAAAARIEVAAALEPEEDAPRELRPLRESDAPADVVFSPTWTALGAGIALLGAGLLVYFVRRQRALERRVAHVPGVYERLAALEAEAERLDAAALAHALAALARDGVSELSPGLRVQRGSAARAALTDEEFVAALDARASERERLSGLLLHLQGARWAGASASPFARQTWLTETRECLDALRARGLRGAEPAERAEAVA